MTPGNLSTHFRVDYHWADAGYISWGFTLLLRSAEHTSASNPILLGLSEYHKVGCVCTCLPESSSFFVITSNNSLNIHNVQLAVDSMRHRGWIPWGVFSSIDYFPLNLKFSLSFLPQTLRKMASCLNSKTLPNEKCSHKLRPLKSDKRRHQEGQDQVSLSPSTMQRRTRLACAGPTMGRKRRGEEVVETVCSIRMKAIGQMVLILSLFSGRPCTELQEECSGSILSALPQSYFCCLFVY